jgi:glyoxylase-like metal-dependent hydrolase (beta-lactamase superfamily II)
MNVIPFVHEGLGNSSYLVGLDDGRALLIDADRSVDRYLRAADERGWRITAALETHMHADFVSGVREVAARIGAQVFLPEGEHARFDHTGVAAGQSLQLYGVQIDVIGSPGHTPEHLSYVLRMAAGPPRLFSGGSLIVGGAARTDLVAPDMTETLSRAQYHTLRGAFAALPDETLLLPTHGGGSFCSAGAGSERTSTLGEERRANPVLDIEDEEEFVRWFPTTFPAAPDYFFRMRDINQAGPPLRADVAAPPALSPSDFDAARDDGLVIDVRNMAAYARAHIPGSLNIAFRDAYAVWLGWLAPPDAPLIFVTGKASIDRVVEESLLVGYERYAGWLEGGIDAWKAAGLTLREQRFVDAKQARQRIVAGSAVVDVREPDEVADGKVEDALTIPLGELSRRVDEVPRDRPVVVYCAHGERAASGASLLERAGLLDLAIVKGGFEAWRELEFPMELPA